MLKTATIVGGLLLALARVGLAQVFPLEIATVSPLPRSLHNDASITISVQFTAEMDSASVVNADNFVVFGNQSGPKDGALHYTPATRVASFTPASPFLPGEVVTVVLTRDIRSVQAVPLSAAFQWSFYIATSPGTRIFALDSTYATRRGPHFVGVGALDPGQSPDLAVPHSVDERVVVWLNSGDGTLSESDQEKVGKSPRSLTLGDFDGDGLVDLAAANQNDDTITLLLNRGSGRFAKNGPALVTGDGPIFVSCDDLNGDGLVDLVTANELANSVSVFLNLGGGAFQNRVDLPTPPRPQSCMIGDLDNDGRQELVVSSADANSVTVFSADTSGDFAATQTVTVGQTPRHLVLHDLDGDGFLDVAVANRGENSLSVLLNEAGVLGDPTTFQVGDDPVALTAGDFDGDSDIDLVVANRLSNDLYLLANNGVGSFAVGTIIPTETQPRGVNSADFNGDGVLDLAVANWTSRSIQVFLNAPGQNQNTAPLAPVLMAPDDRVLANLNASPLLLSWGSPADAEGDLLHFMIEIATDPGFSQIVRSVDSRTSGLGFTPPPPVAPGGVEVDYTLGPGLEDGQYWWRVSAWDGQVFGPPSASRRFVLDSTPPNITSITLTTPDFPPNWYSSSRSNSIALSVQYDEAHAQRAVFDFGALGGGVSEPIDSGVGRTVQTQVGIGGVADGTYLLKVTLWDSVGNSSEDSVTIALDGTPPSGTLASSPAVSVDETFPVSWADSGSDGSGSGLAGIYDVRVQVNDGPWTDWLTNFQGTTADYPGSDGQRYGFEVAAHDNVGNVEAFLEVAESVTTVNVNANDVDAPGPPPGIEARGSSDDVWQSEPVFTVSWQEPDDPSGIARALYKLGSPPTANFDTTGSVTGATSVQVTATQEDGQNFHLWFVDTQGNVDFRNRGMVTLHYDGTAPIFQKIEITNADFPPNWFNPRRTQEAKVVASYSEKHLQLVALVSTDLDTVIERKQARSGENIEETFAVRLRGREDGLYELIFTLIDSAGNRRRETTEIALDASPPTGTTATSPDSVRTLSFQVSWGGTGSDGQGVGLSGVFDVQFQVNDDDWQPWLIDFAGSSATFEGEQGNVYGFEAAAHDNLDNVEIFNNLAESVTVVDTGFVDIEPPAITHTPVPTVNEGQAATISTQVQDNSQVAEVVLFYKQGGKRVFQSRQMESDGAGTYSATLSPTEIAGRGIDYFIMASDGSNVSHHPARDWESRPNHLSVRIAGPNGQGLSRPQPLPAGTTATAYRMLAVPLSLDAPDPRAVLEDDLGTYDPAVWRLFQYKSGNYVEFPNVDAFAPGNALWIIVRDPNKVVDSGSGTTVPTNQPFEVVLNEGWNDLSNPFPFPIDWSEVEVAPANSGAVVGPYTYQGDWLLPDQVSTLFPWEGYSVFSRTSGVTLRLPQFEAAGSGAAALTKILSEPAWRITIEAHSGELRDRRNDIGVAEDAAREWDARDYLEPPYIADFVSVGFPHPDWQSFPGTFTTDFRPPFVDGDIWHMAVETRETDAEVTLTFGNLETVPASFQVFLVDRTTGQRVDLRTTPVYRFVPRSGSDERNVDLVVGTEAFIRASGQETPLIPEEFSISQNFPNPFNAGTTLHYRVAEPAFVTVKVLNVLGQEIRRLVSAPHTPGAYRVHWDGKSDGGVEMSSGIYLVRFEAGPVHQTRKMLLIR